MMANQKDLEYFQQKHYTNVNGEEIPYHKIYNDVNGNPRRVVHFTDLGVKLDDYGKIPGLSKYRAKWFGGGYVLESCYNVQEDLKWTLEKVEEYYKKNK
jgi:hypothetical protein